MCNFDLNQEIQSDDNGIFTPVSFASDSRLAAAPGLPEALSQYDGTLGRKGSALPSTFCPASPHRISDGNKAASMGGSSNSSKRSQDCLDIDLNVADNREDEFEDPTLEKQIPASFGLPSGEVDPRKSEKLKLDLNRIGEDGDVLSSDFRMQGQLLHHQNGRRSQSRASSSTSMQLSMRNFDLNERASIQNDSSKEVPYFASPLQNISAYGGMEPDDLVIMGTRVEVKKKNVIPQTISLSNFKAVEFPMDDNVARTAAAPLLSKDPTVSYLHPPFGYSGLTAGPTMSFYSAMDGSGSSIPYMVDLGGAPIVPEYGSASVVPPYTHSPNIMSMTTAPLGLNGVGLSQSNFDPNSSFVIEGRNWDSSGLRQPFVPGQGRSLEEHLMANSLPSSSGVSAKRKEPDGGCEAYPFNYKHQQSPWK